jgi:putative membrane protein
MKLVLCIDRDNDLGSKAHLQCPIVGREDNVNAALQLGLIDPEDSDVNAIFEGIRVYDDLKSEGVDAEIASIAGSEDVGLKSDQILAKQLDFVLKKVNATSVVIVSDGAEDEFILPIVESRIQIDGVKRVVIRQSESLESTYYTIKKLFEDPKIANYFFIPVGLTLILFAIFSFARQPEGALIVISAFIGIYLLFRGFGLDEPLEGIVRSVKSSFYGGNISFVTYMVALALGIIGMAQGIITTLSLDFSSYGGVLTAAVFINTAVWWFVAAGVIAIIGRIIDAYLNDTKHAWRRVEIPFFIFSTGLILWSASILILALGGKPIPVLNPADVLITQTSRSIEIVTGFQLLLFSVAGAIIIALTGIAISSLIKRGQEPPIAQHSPPSSSEK